MKSVGKNSSKNKGSNVIHTSKKVERLLSFLRDYIELWYENGRSIDEKISLITSDEKEKARIRGLYEQAQKDFSALRAIRTRFYEHKNGKHTTPTYDITEEQIEQLRQAGIGRTFGLSDERKREFDRLLSLGVDKNVLSYIFKKFTSYQRFKEIYSEAIEQGREKEVLRKCPRTANFIVSEIDLSRANGVRETDRNYVELLRDVLGVQYFVFDGTNLVSEMNRFIDFDLDKTRTVLTANERRIIRDIYGLNGTKMTSDQLSKVMKLSNSRVRQILDYGISKLAQRKSQLYNIVYLSDDSETRRFLVNYYRKNVVLRGSGMQQENLNITKNSVKTDDIGLSDDIYCASFARHLRDKIATLEQERSIVNAKMKMQFDDVLDRFEDIDFQDFTVGRMNISKFNLSKRTRTCLINGISKNRACNIRDIIEFSRACDAPIHKKIKYMGGKSYEELTTLMRRLGLVLEDEEKSPETEIKNEKILCRMSKIDSAKLALYLEQIRYRARTRFLIDSSKIEIEDRIDFIKNTHGIRITNEDLAESIRTKIDLLGYPFDYDTSIEIMEIPYEVIRILKSHGIDRVLDIYRLRDRDINYLRKTYGAYFDFVTTELERMGLEYPVVWNEQRCLMKTASYMNKPNIEFISYLINESSLDEKVKDELNRMLISKIKQVEQTSAKNVDNELLGKIEALRDSYQTLATKEQMLAKLQERQNKTEADPDDDFGDI